MDKKKFTIGMLLFIFSALFFFSYVISQSTLYFVLSRYLSGLLVLISAITTGISIGKTKITKIGYTLVFFGLFSSILISVAELVSSGGHPPISILLIISIPLIVLGLIINLIEMFIKKSR